jgi:chemotaxis protein histidine kinase CheA
MDTQSFNGRLFELRQRFITAMPEKVGSISETLARCAGDDRSAMYRLERQFHTLAGTAGTYGLMAVAAAAREAEEACAELHESSMDGESFYYLQYLVDQVRRAASCVDAVEQRGSQAA